MPGPSKSCAGVYRPNPRGDSNTDHYRKGGLPTVRFAADTGSSGGKVVVVQARLTGGRFLPILG